jgi:3-dehydro-L-gulonate 2-dehydrogenase
MKKLNWKAYSDNFNFLLMKKNIQNKIEFIRIPFEQMLNVFYNVLLKHSFTEEKAKICAKVFAENSLDGVYTHGVNRFPRFIKYIKEKCIDVNAVPVRKSGSGAMEQWDGNLGPGPLNALFSTDRAMNLADEFGIGCVALANTNHWMRGGTYGWRAAKEGFVFIGWTNTIGNMPAWGAVDAKLGNNPVVFAIPFNNEAIVLDMALSQFSYGKMEEAHAKGEKLSFPGGYNKEGNLTQNPTEVLESWRSLSIGYWKGAGLALLLDILAAVLSGGQSTFEISKRKLEYGLSQVFIAISLSNLGNYPAISDTVNNIINDYYDSVKDTNANEILYPGERVLRTRNENLKLGIPVDKDLWNKILIDN